MTRMQLGLLYRGENCYTCTIFGATAAASAGAMGVRGVVFGGAVAPRGRLVPKAMRVSSEGLIEAAKLGRVAGDRAGARARQAEKQRRHAAELKAWNPSDQPQWLTEKVSREKVQPRLSGITVAIISSALGISQPYAAEIRAGRCLPHLRHWQSLARVAGIVAKMTRGQLVPHSPRRYHARQAGASWGQVIGPV